MKNCAFLARTTMNKYALKTCSVLRILFICPSYSNIRMEMCISATHISLFYARYTVPQIGVAQPLCIHDQRASTICDSSTLHSAPSYSLPQSPDTLRSLVTNTMARQSRSMGQ